MLIIVISAPPSDNILSSFLSNVETKRSHQVSKCGVIFVLVLSRFVQLITSVVRYWVNMNVGAVWFE